MKVWFLSTHACLFHREMGCLIALSPWFLPSSLLLIWFTSYVFEHGFCLLLCFSLHLRSALDILLLVSLMVLLGYLMFAHLIGKHFSIQILWPSAIWFILWICSMCPIQYPASSFFSANLFFTMNILILYCRIVYMARPHAPRTEKVVGIGFQPGFDPYKVNSTYLHLHAMRLLFWFDEACQTILWQALQCLLILMIIYVITDCKCIPSWGHSISWS